MKMEKIMQDIFKRLINEIFLLKFKPYGWKKQGSNFRYIDASGLGRVINFQKSKWNTADELEFFINYGLYIEIDNQLVNKSFKEYECQFRARTGLDKGSFHLNSDTDFETLQRRVEQALDEAINQFDKVGNKEHFPVEFEGGIQMSAQFGGDQYIAGQKEPVIDMPTRFVDFMRVLVPMAGDDTTPEGEQVNIYGNHVGSWNFAATAYLNRWKVKIYYEHYFDDHSQMFFQYGRWKDGHIGLEITFPKNRFIDTFVYEGLGTKDQTGPMLYDSFWGKFEEQISAKDNYYNHYLYQGWQHWGMGIGNPLLPGPIYNKNGQITFISNRVLAHHIGFCGSPCQSLSYRMLLSYSRHWGTYDNPLNEIKKQFNSLFEVTYAPQQLKGWSFTVSGAMDRGNLLGNNYGGMLVIRKQGIIKSGNK